MSVRRIDAAPGVPDAARALARRVPLPGDPAAATLTPLDNVVSLNNHNFCLTADNRRYLLRLASEHARHLGVRRDEELAAARAAADAGVAPAVLYAEPEGHQLLPWIDGRHWEAADFQDPRQRARLAEALRRLHAVRDLPGDGSVFRRIERLIESAVALGLQLPDALEACRRRLDALEASRRADGRLVGSLSHNDLWANNFLDDGERLWLVDWEFAGPGDGFYDLATTAMASGDQASDIDAVTAAAGFADAGAREVVRQMRTAVRAFEGAWALVQHGLQGSEGFDYIGYAHKMFAQLAAE